MKSISCLTTIVHAQNDIELSQVIDTVKRFRAAKKQLVINIHELDINSLQNNTINFNVIIKHQTKGDAR